MLFGRHTPAQLASTAARLPLADEAAALLQGAKNTVYARCGTTTAKERLRGRSDAAKALHPKFAKSEPFVTRIVELSVQLAYRVSV